MFHLHPNGPKKGERKKSRNPVNNVKLSVRPEFPVNTSMCLCLKINSLGKSQYVTGKKERKKS